MFINVSPAGKESDIVESLIFLPERTGFGVGVAADGRQTPKTVLER